MVKDRAAAWHEKKNRLAEAQFERDLAALGDNESKAKNQASAAALGGGRRPSSRRK